MEPTIIVALIMAVATILTQVIIAAVSKKSTTDMINYKIDELSKKVSAHNSLIDRMYKCESRLRLLEEDKKE